MLYSRDLASGIAKRLPFSNSLPAPDPVRGWQSEAVVGFAPDARQLIIVNTYPVPGSEVKEKPQQYTACRLINIDGTGLKQLYRSAPFPTPLTHEDQEWNYSPTVIPRWSRDGSRLALFTPAAKNGEEFFTVYDRFGSRFKVMEYFREETDLNRPVRRAK